MTKSIIAVMFLASALFSTSSQAAWEAGLAQEYYTWTEYPPDLARTLKESGPRSALHLNWTSAGEEGLLVGYRGRVYFGRVNYDTVTMVSHTPATTTTEYSGMTHEMQFIGRNDVGAHKLDVVGGLGWDYWRRHIGSGSQIEDYSVLYLRGGLNLGQPAHQAGFHGGGGLKLPVWITEDAHLKNLGYQTNPTLVPGANLSTYAEFGYRINNRIDFSAYYDSWRFAQSGIVTAKNAAGATKGLLQPKSNMDAFGLRAMFSF